ncbi:hypothetical protein MASR1M74_01730 [Lentimicrobium sp.]
MIHSDELSTIFPFRCYTSVLQAILPLEHQISASLYLSIVSCISTISREIMRPAVGKVLYVEHILSGRNKTIP